MSRHYRNRRIGEFLKELDLTEGRSTGLPKMFEKMAHNGSPKPVFETDEDRTYFLVRLPVHEKVAELEQANEQVTHQVTDQVTDQVKLALSVLEEIELGTKDLMQKVSLKHRPTFMHNYLLPALEHGLVEMPQPDSPRSPTQKYRLTPLGKQVLADIKNGL